MIDKIAFVSFLKKHSTIPNTFIDEFSGFLIHDYNQTKICVDLDIVCKWLNVRKDEVMSTLRSSYRNGIDYTITKGTNKKGKYGGNNYRIVMITPDCFKRLCMRSKSKKSEEVRSYYIALEGLLMKYFEQLLHGMQSEIQGMKKQISPSKDKTDHAGYIYVLRASTTKDSVYKIGRTKDLGQRLSSYQTGRLEEVEVVFKWRTENLKAMETCIKSMLYEYKPRKYKEIYEANIDLIKKLIENCEQIQGIKEVYQLRKPSIMTGGYYLGIVKACD